MEREKNTSSKFFFSLSLWRTTRAVISFLNKFMRISSSFWVEYHCFFRLTKVHDGIDTRAENSFSKDTFSIVRRKKEIESNAVNVWFYPASFPCICNVVCYLSKEKGISRSRPLSTRTASTIVNTTNTDNKYSFLFFAISLSRSFVDAIKRLVLCGC